MQVEAWLQRAARRTPTVTALQTADGQLTYAQLHRVAHAGAVELAERGVQRGSRVAIALPPGLAFVHTLHACLLHGAVAVPIDLRLSATERERLLADAHALVDEPLSSLASSSVAHGACTGDKRVPGGVRVASDAPLAAGAAPHDLSADDATDTHELDAVAVVIHTSGTTSAPKPIELTYGNFLWSALGSGVALGVDSRERWLCALPLSHVGGLSILLRSAIYCTTAVVHERFDTERVLRALTDEQITLVSLVSTTLARLLDAGLREPSHLRCALTGGGPVPAALVRRAHAAGVTVAETYGLTECCSQAATAPLALGEPAGGAALAGLPGARAHEVGAGVPLFCTRTEIAADGEIVLSGPTVARSARAADGRLYTGDLGRIDRAGFLHVTGRKADTIVSGGENVAPAEVEAALQACEGVIEAAVIGREDPQWGEAVTAIVVVAAHTSLRESTLREHCVKLLAPYKVPKRFTLVSRPLPRTASGKLLRREL
jgi:O-succinylbenzoic acid--CoA ligase